jgi:hypothetical protein
MGHIRHDFVQTPQVLGCSVGKLLADQLHKRGEQEVRIPATLDIKLDNIDCERHARVARINPSQLADARPAGSG